MSDEFQIIRRVEFSETDMAGIMHFSNFFRFMETAEHAFFRSLGLSVVLSRNGFTVHLPRVHAECDYLAPLHFEDEVSIRLRVQKMGRRSLTYAFRFFAVNRPKPVEVARGLLTVVCAEKTADGKLRAVPFPAAIANRIQQAPVEVSAAINGNESGILKASRKPASTRLGRD